MKFRIKEARLAANLTQKELAEKLGITDATLSGYETGAHDPKSNRLAEIAKICNTTVDYLLGVDRVGPSEEKEPDTLVGLDKDESRLVSIYRELNQKGKSALMKQADYLMGDPEMKKDGQSSIETA